VSAYVIAHTLSRGIHSALPALLIVYSTLVTAGSALDAACAAGRLVALELLLKAPGTDVNYRDEHHWTPIFSLGKAPMCRHLPRCNPGERL